MTTETDHASARLISDPLRSWLFHRPVADALTKLVLRDARPAQKITALTRFLGLTGHSSQISQWEALLQVASIDVAVARMLEPHVDALGILAEAGHATPDRHSAWGVYAAESPKYAASASGEGSELTITGGKAWCSLASELTHAIVIAHGEEGSRAHAVDLRDSRVQPEAGTWPSLGLREIPSGAVKFGQAPATAVGPAGWYLDRPSFAWGGIRVSACWFGGALGMAQVAARLHLARPGPSAVGEMQLGQLDAEIFTARTALSEAATAADSDRGFTRAEAWALALKVRNIVYRGVQRIQHLSRELAGPAALTGDPAFAKADADLTVYISQHHGPRDEAALGTEFRRSAENNEL
ncbi:MAG: hypothetical protein L0G46_08235 [Kocuria sp.]|nr:hypothetical protein [Kocuria sp.]